MNRKTLWKLLAVLVILAGGILWYFLLPREGVHAISVVELNGTALVERSGMKISVYEGMKLKDGDSICAVSGQEVILGMDGIPFAVLEAGAKLGIERIKEEINGTQIQMEEGSVLFLSGATLSGTAPKQAAELLLSAGGLRIDANGASFYITVQDKEGIKHTDLSVWSGRVMAVPLAGGKEESIAEGMTATYLLDELGVSSKGQKAFTLFQFSEHVLEKLLTADKAQSPFCVSREELVKELEEREAVAAGSTGYVSSVADLPKLTPKPSFTLTPEPSFTLSPTPSANLALSPEPSPISGDRPQSTPSMQLSPTEGSEPTPEPTSEAAAPEPPMASLQNPSPFPSAEATAPAPRIPSELESRFTELIGQTPETDAEDGIFTYYEFAAGMLAAAEPRLAASESNMEAVLMGFAFRLITGGIDINSLDVNKPITREDAALFTWYGAQSIGCAGMGADIADASAYVTDIADCTLARQRAIGYLYQEGYEEGYQKEGQKFRPQDILTTEEGTAWIRSSAEQWKLE